jgi:hypothetical protein
MMLEWQCRSLWISFNGLVARGCVASLRTSSQNCFPHMQLSQKLVWRKLSLQSSCGPYHTMGPFPSNCCITVATIQSTWFKWSQRRKMMQSLLVLSSLLFLDSPIVFYPPFKPMHVKNQSSSDQPVDLNWFTSLCPMNMLK